MTPIPCPACGTPASGKFCATCGTALQRSACPRCRAALPSAARFCHACGAPLGRRPGGPGRRWSGWVAGGTAALALVVAGTVLAGRRDAAPVTPTALPTSAAPDISNLTPRERAFRLFDRIMAAAENGDSSQITFFYPMAVSAYSALAPLDNVARYDLGVLHILAGEFAAARAQLDSLVLDAPRHLLGAILEFTLARAANDPAGSRAAAARFLEHYETERATDNPDYQVHQRAIDNFIPEARRATGTAD